jgi:hypothetical protein
VRRYEESWAEALVALKGALEDEREDASDEGGTDAGRTPDRG